VIVRKRQAVDNIPPEYEPGDFAVAAALKRTSAIDQLFLFQP
jgi:hypothetical protein